MRRQSWTPTAVDGLPPLPDAWAARGRDPRDGFRLVVIETRTARSYQEQPSFAAAFLDASSAVGAQTSPPGWCAQLPVKTSQRESAKVSILISTSMVHLMAAMFVGRTLLVIALSWFGGLRLTESESTRAAAVL